MRFLPRHLFISAQDRKNKRPSSTLPGYWTTWMDKSAQHYQLEAKNASAEPYNTRALCLNSLVVDFIMAKRQN